MKTFGLKRVPAPPPPPEPKTCVACKAFRAECVVPVDESSAPMCWLCAHHVVDHDCAPHEAMTAECECLPHRIYPGREASAVITHDEVISVFHDEAENVDLKRALAQIEKLYADHPQIAEYRRFVDVKVDGFVKQGAAPLAPVATVAQNAARRKAPKLP